MESTLAEIVEPFLLELLHQPSIPLVTLSVTGNGNANGISYVYFVLYVWCMVVVGTSYSIRILLNCYNNSYISSTIFFFFLPVHDKHTKWLCSCINVFYSTVFFFFSFFRSTIIILSFCRSTFCYRTKISSFVMHHQSVCVCAVSACVSKFRSQFSAMTECYIQNPLSD